MRGNHGYDFRPGSNGIYPLLTSSQLDFFHINFTVVWLILAVELIV